MSKQDRQGVRTAVDLERKYDLAALAGIKKAVESSVEELNKTNTTLEEFIISTLGTLDNMQSQIDGNISTWFDKGIPTLENKPASEWTTEEDKINHLGDLFYDKDTGYAYRFSMTDNSYEWIKITDNDVVEALAHANAAQDTADGKRRVFVEQPIPPYDNGDLWFNNQEIYICQVTKDKNEVYETKDFIIATKYTDDTYAIKVGNELKVVSGTVTTIKEGFDSFKVDITTTVETIDAELLVAQTSIEANTSEIALKVNKNGVIAAINLSEETALIKANRINLIGAVTISDLDTNLHQTLNTAGSNAISALEAATRANTTLADWCYNNDTTYIDGANLYTGSVTAEKIKVTDLSALGATIGNWDIKDGYMKTDILANDGYLRRGYIQSHATTNPNNTWIFSVQKGIQSGNSPTTLNGLWYVTGDGDMYTQNLAVAGKVSINDVENGLYISSGNVVANYIESSNVQAKKIIAGTPTASYGDYEFVCHGNAYITKHLQAKGMIEVLSDGNASNLVLHNDYDRKAYIRIDESQLLWFVPHTDSDFDTSNGAYLNLKTGNFSANNFISKATGLDFNALSQKTDGKFVLGNGLKICWGWVSTTNLNGFFRSATVTFPVTYTKAPIVCTTDWIYNQDSLDSRVTTSIRQYSTTGCTLIAKDPSGELGNRNVDINWIAIGY